MADLSSLLAQAAARWGIPLNLLTAMARQESAFSTTAVSPKGAQGVMQLMPATAIAYGVTNPFDPAQNIDAGAHLMSDLLRKYNGDTSLALAAYNAGSGNVSKYGGIPPFPETQNYVARILGSIGQDQPVGAGSGYTAPDSSDSTGGFLDEFAGESELSDGAKIGIAIAGAALLVVLFA